MNPRVLINKERRSPVRRGDLKIALLESAYKQSVKWPVWIKYFVLVLRNGEISLKRPK